MAQTVRKYCLIVVALFSVVFQSNAQKMTIMLADKSFKDFAFVEAIELYEFAYKKDTTDNYVVRQLAEANRNIGNTEQVEYWLKKLIDRRVEQPEDLFNYSQALKSNGKYLKAEQWLKEYAGLRPEDGRVNIQVSLLEYISFLMRDSSKYEIRNLKVNTPGSDMGPFIDNGQLVFSSTSMHGNSGPRYQWNNLPYLDMYAGKILADGEIGKPEPFAPKLKTSFHDGPVSIDFRNKRMFFTRNNYLKGKTFKSKDGTVNLKIFLAGFEENDWKLTGSFVYNSDQYSVGHPSVDKTGTVLYFASDRPGGYGKSDLYFSVFTNGHWSDPVNLGPKVNTEGNEFFPFISNDGVLYFASDGHGGLGALDIFFSVPDRGVFNSVENMGYPVNSSMDDFALALDSTGMNGYFTSNRPGGKGDDDLYYLKVKYVPVIVRGVVKDRDTKTVLPDARIAVVDSKGDTISRSITRLDGQFEFEVNKGQEYTIDVRKEFYFGNEKKVATASLRPNDEVFAEIFLEQDLERADNYPEPINIEEEDGEALQVIELEYINYDLDKWEIRPDAAEILNRLITVMNEYPGLEIRLESHTDARGSDEYNMLLSKKRARSAFDYLVSKGIDPNRMRYEGYGETRLLNRCGNGVECSEQEHEVNRRTIVKVVRKGEYQNKRGQRNIFYF